MIKKMIKKMLQQSGYEIVKKYNSGHQDAIFHNSIENVNSKNSNLLHFKQNIKGDSVFINCIFTHIKKLFKDTEMKFLDVGCGSGVLVDKLIEHNLSNYIKGCDFSDLKITQCNNYYQKDCFFVYNVMKPLKENYDLITCTEVFEHLEFPEKAFSNLLNAIKQNGILVITVPNGRKDTYVGHIHFWSPESFKLFITKVLSNYDAHFFEFEFEVEFKLLCDKNFVQIKRIK